MASYSKAIHSQMAYPASIVHVCSCSTISPVPHMSIVERQVAITRAGLTMMVVPPKSHHLFWRSLST